MASQDERLMDNDREEPALPLRRAAGQNPRARAARVDERVSDEREAQARALTENRDISDDDRVEMFRASLHQSILPDLPLFPGYHVCWLTTNNSRDTIAHRLRIGYELIREEWCPGWIGGSQGASRIPGIVGVEEMVAARIPLRLYNEYIRIQHHEAPNDEEEKILRRAEELGEQAARMGVELQGHDGLGSLRTRAPRPTPLTE